MIVFPLRTILRLLGNESKVHLFQAILFQEMLPTRVKSHLTRFLAEFYGGFTLAPRRCSTQHLSQNTSLSSYTCSALFLAGKRVGTPYVVCRYA